MLLTPLSVTEGSTVLMRYWNAVPVLAKKGWPKTEERVDGDRLVD
jgi:hypothetical protein